MQGRQRISPRAWVRHREGLDAGTVEVGGLDGWDGWKFQVRVDTATTGTPKVVDLRIIAPAGEHLHARRTIPYGELARLAAVGAPGHLDLDAWLDEYGSRITDDNGSRATGRRRFSASDLPRKGSAGYEKAAREFYENVAEVYLAAQVDGITTWRAIVAAFGLLDSNAPPSAVKAAMRKSDRLIAGAREYGLIPPARPTKERTSK